MIDMLHRKDGQGGTAGSYQNMVENQSTDIGTHLTPALPQMPQPIQPQMPHPIQPPSGGGGVVMPAPAQPNSWKSMMASNVGREVLISSLVGSQNTVIAQGTLYEVGNDYVTLYHPGRQSLISTDIYAIRYIEFLPDTNREQMDMGDWQNSMQ